MAVPVVIPAAPSQYAAALLKITRRLEMVIQWLTEPVAAVLVIVEVALLFANVIYRYLLHDPLTWGDELASLLFMWMAMLGAVIALRRDEHMRLTSIVAKMNPSRRAFMHTFAGVVVVTFLLVLLPWAYEYAIEEWQITTPALEVRNTYRVGALPVGLTCMLLIASGRLLAQSCWKNLWVSVTVVGGLALILYAVSEQLQGLGNFNLLIFFLLGVPVMVMSGAPIMVSFGLATLAYLGMTTTTPLLIVVGRMDEGMSSIILLAVPLFVFLGALIEATGMAEAMVRALASMIGHVKGGLSYVLVGAMYLVSGISGSKAADMAAVAPALFPEMKKRGEDEGDLVAMLSSSGAMSETIPPSLVLITVGSVMGISISALFTGGFMPALVGAIAMSAVIWLKNRKRKHVVVTRAATSVILKSFGFALPALALPLVIRSAVVEGVATATEVATIGVVYTFAVGLIIYRRFDWRRLYPMLVETVSLSGAILIIIGCASAMAWALIQSGFSRELEHVMLHIPGGKAGFLLVSAIAFVLLGCFLEGIPALVLFGPIMFPIAHTMGIHEVHYTMIVVFAMGLGLFAPPLGIGFYAACAISKSDPALAMKKVWPYLGALCVALLCLLTFPWLSIGFL